MIMATHCYYVVSISWRHVKIDAHDRMSDETRWRHALTVESLEILVCKKCWKMAEHVIAVVDHASRPLSGLTLSLHRRKVTSRALLCASALHRKAWMQTWRSAPVMRSDVILHKKSCRNWMKTMTVVYFMSSVKCGLFDFLVNARIWENQRCL